MSPPREPFANFRLCLLIATNIVANINTSKSLQKRRKQFASRRKSSPRLDKIVVWVIHRYFYNYSICKLLLITIICKCEYFAHTNLVNFQDIPLSSEENATLYHYYPHNQHLFSLPSCASQQVNNSSFYFEIVFPFYLKDDLSTIIQGCLIVATYF